MNGITSIKKIIVYLYMLETLGEDPDERDEQSVFDLEKEYCELVKELLEGKVITFSCSDCSEDHTGICERVDFEGGFQAPERGFFHVEHIQLKLEDFDEPHNLDDDKIIVHLDGDADLYRNVKKYNV